MAMEEERRKLREIINHWNENRLDLFEISLPNEDLEFHGVMRFYFQDKMSGNFATKCIRVSSTATTSDVVETLSEKFRPDIRMLTAPRYSLYEVHSSGEERRLGEHEKPLVVQLNWNKDDREGRFVLKNENDIAPVKKVDRNGAGKAEKEGVMQNFKRTLSKKERKEKKRREREASRCEEDEENAPDVGAAPQADSAGVAEEVYKEMPETSFTRTISNPEVVMKRRRQQKLERRLQEFHGDDGRPRSGGMLRVFADSLRPTIPYKTLLVSLSDPAEFVVREVLDKYGLEREDPANYCLARLVLPPDSDMMEEAVRREGLETALDDQDCPLNILVEWPAEDGVLVFQLRKKEDVAARRKKQQQQQHKAVGKGAGEGQEERRRGGGGDAAPGADAGSGHDAYGAAPPPDRLPYLVELSPGGRHSHRSYRTPDGSDSRDKPKMYRLQLNVTEVGSDTSSPQFIQLFGAGIQPQHCVVTNMEGVVTVTPSSVEADTFVQGRRISETTMLRSGSTLRFGRASVFKFVDPGHEPPGVSSAGGVRRAAEGETEPARAAAVGGGSVPVPHETTFELDGDVHSNSDAHAKRQADGRSVMRPDRVEFTKSELRGHEKPSQIIDLPATLELREGAEEAFLAGVVNYTNSTTAHFKLSPTYALYLAARRTLGSPNAAGEDERLRRTVALVNRTVAMMEAVIQEQSGMASALAFWMANASELLNFLKQDVELGRVTAEGQDVLASGVHTAFRHLVHCLQSDLNKCMPAFLEDPEEPSAQGPKIDDVLQTLSGAMSLLRRCRVNAALTIQLFSQLFHFVNMWLFNELARGAAARQPLCSYYWGVALHERLHAVEGWAERQGLELAADCHLSRIMQATTLLTMDKYAPKDVPEISSTCFKLNSLQLRALLEGYQGATGEPSIPRELIDSVVAVATSTADELAHSDLREVRLEEDPDLQLPFLLPEDGYSCDIVKGVPHGLAEFLAPLCQRGLCRLVPLPRSPGVWTVFFEGHDNDSGPLPPADTGSLHHQVPKVLTVTLKKQHGLGLSIVAAKGAGLDKLGIYIKSVVKGGAADQDGRLAAGDQLLSVDGNSLVGLSQERAAELMTRTGSVVTLEIAKQGAIYHGLATLLNEPSPTTQHRGSDHRTGGKARPKSEGLELYRGSARPDSPEEPAETHTDAQQLQEQQGAATHGDDRLVKNRADHRSTPNVAHSPDSGSLRPVYPGAPACRVQSVSTGNLKAEESPSPPSLEAYPVPTATYAREYSTLPPPPADSSPAWAASSMQRAAHSEEELRRDRPYRAGAPLPPHHHGPQQARRQQPPSSLLSSSASSSSHEQLAPPARAPQYGIAVGGAASAKTGPGRWKTPVVVGAPPAKHGGGGGQQGGLPPPPPPTRYPPGYGPESRDLPPPPPPPPPASALHGMGGMGGGGGGGGGGTSSSLSSLSSPSLPSPGYGGDAGPDAERKREEQLRWYEAEKARLEEERERQRRRKAAGAAAPGGGGAGSGGGGASTGAAVRPHERPALPPQGETIIRELRPQSQPRTIERHDLHFLVPPPAGTGEEEGASGSPQLSPSPWARDARERQEKQRQQQQLEMLEREIAALQSRPQHQLLPEESDRLRKLLLEREFQRRVQEVSLRRRGDDDDDDDDDYEERDDGDGDGGGTGVGAPAAGQKQTEKPLPWQHQQTGDFHHHQQQQQQQRHEEETRVLQAFPTLSVLHLLQDEERRKHQQQAEERARQQREAEERLRLQREAEERARQQREAEERARQQREAEERARQREAEERARQQREAEERARQREAEERARQQREAEERARQQREAEERARQQREAEERTRKVDEQRRREDDYYAHLESERRRALDEEERRLLGPGGNNNNNDNDGDGDGDDGASTAAAASPPAPSQQSKPRGGGGSGGGGGGDLHRAMLVRCGDGDEVEEEDSAKTRDARANPAATAAATAPLRWQQQPGGGGGGGGAVTARRPPLARPQRPLSDGFALSSAAGGAAGGLGRRAPSVAASSSMADLARVGGGGGGGGGAVGAAAAQQHRGAPSSLLLTYASPGNSQGMNTYRPGGTPGVIGSQEVYRDPRERRTSQSKPEAGERPSPMPEKLPFRERQRLFSQGQDVANKIKTSRKLMELEQELGNK
ncbi:afadin isoform X2 [Petromyzon marinus]|uniref:afadin isoform X2 n=1 Tax=Petromyzon marinus TaxID=7757 RepID=UPI003F6F0FC8